MKSMHIYVLLFLLIAAPQTIGARAVKKFTFIVYMAADNNLYYFAKQNLTSMKTGINSSVSDVVNVVVQVDHRGSESKPERLLIENNAIIKHEKDNESLTKKIDFGQIETLVDCVRWAVTEYPAEHYALILWNHGIGAVDFMPGRVINPSELFLFNPAISRLELDRSISFLDYLDFASDDRGICFSDTFASYLTNQKLETALKIISTDILGKKLDLLGFDACLMSMVEIASLAAPYADIMVGSQEVELANGWPYELIFKKLPKNLSPETFASHIVSAYESHYRSITHDYTQSAINLQYISLLEENIKKVVALLTDLFKGDKKNIMQQFIRTCKSKKICTSFSEQSYIDFTNFYKNIYSGIAVLARKEMIDETTKTALQNLIEEGISIITSAIIANAAGKSLPGAHGLSIYFPGYKVHSSYAASHFAHNTGWLPFIESLIA